MVLIMGKPGIVDDDCIAASRAAGILIESDRGEPDKYWECQNKIDGIKACRRSGMSRKEPTVNCPACLGHDWKEITKKEYESRKQLDTHDTKGIMTHGN